MFVAHAENFPDPLAVGSTQSECLENALDVIDKIAMDETNILCYKAQEVLWSQVTSAQIRIESK